MVVASMYQLARNSLNCLDVYILQIILLKILGYFSFWCSLISGHYNVYSNRFDLIINSCTTVLFV